MKTLIKFIAVVMTVSLPLLASAQGKVAVLNVQAAIINTELAQSRLKSLRAESSYAENRKELEKLGKSLQDKAKQLQKDAAVMSVEKRQAEAQKIQEQRADIEHVQRKLQVAEQQLLQSIAQELEPKLKVAIDELIKTEGIGLLINQQAAMYADSAFSITAKLTDKLNQMK